MKYFFKNEESGKQIEFETKKDNIIIYGKNGSGKTTFSRSTNFEKKLVFNEYFVNKNIYIIGIDGAKTDKDTKNGFSELWIGADIIAERKNLGKLYEIKKEIISSENEVYKNLNSNETLRKVISIESIKNKTEQYEDKKVIFDIDLDYNKTLNSYKIKNEEFPTSIKNNEDYKKAINLALKNDIATNFLQKIKDDAFLDSIFVKNDENALNELNGKITELNSRKEEANAVKKFVERKEITNEMIGKMSEVIKHQQTVKKCIICGKDGITNEVSEWLSIIQNTFSIEKKKILSLLEKTATATKDINKNKKWYREAMPELFDEIISFGELITESLNKTKENDFIKIKYKIVSTQKELKDLSKLIDEIENYTILGIGSKLLFPIVYNKLTEKSIVDSKGKLNKLLIANASNYGDNINFVLKELGLEKAVNIVLDTKSKNDIKYDLIVKGQKIGELSDGQKHKLALGIFLSSIDKENLNNKIIVIDDPVVAMDVETYHLFKKYFIAYIAKKIEENKWNTKIITMTHNIHFLYVQTSNILEEENLQKITVIYKLSSSKITEIPLELLYMDDIILFKKALCQANNTSKIYLLKTIIIKTFRTLIDLRLRELGIISAGNPVPEIEKLALTTEDEKVIKQVNRNLNTEIKKRNIKLSNILNALTSLKTAARILQFDKLIKTAELEKIDKIIKEGEEFDVLKLQKRYEDPVFEILLRVNYFLESTNPRYADFQNYIQHPRNFFTKNMTAIDMDDSFTKTS